jgi:hypothetical protein
MENAKQQARTQLESIVEMIAALRTASNDREQETAQKRIQEDPLSVEVRSGCLSPRRHVVQSDKSSRGRASAWVTGEQGKRTVTDWTPIESAATGELSFSDAGCLGAEQD